MNEFTHREMTDEERWVQANEHLVGRLPDGYSMSICEYTNDISCRQMIEEHKTSPAIARQWSRIETADNALKAILRPTKRCIHGQYPQSCFWYWGYPAMSLQLEDDLRAIGAM